MLSEQFLTSVETSGKSSSAVSKDVGIHVHDYKPSYALRSSFKKSSSPPKCLAVSSTHIFSAQSDKAVIHVYSRERGNQEAVVPFAERIRVVEFFGDNGGAGILALGTEGGRIILWEVHTGRQVTTPPSHLQEVTALAIDPTNGSLLSGSSDSKILVWSILALLSFSAPPKDYDNSSSSSSLLHTFANHRAGVTGVTTGHSRSQTNIAISTSKSNDCLIWDYHTGDLLRTFILSAVPISLALDPCDRACYVGFENGSIQLIDFFKTNSSIHDEDPTLTSTPVQAVSADLWSQPPESEKSPALCVAVAYEGNFVLSGHSDGYVRVWDVATRNCFTLASLYAPVTNLLMLPLRGLPSRTASSLRLHQVTKPRYESSLSNNQFVGDAGGSSEVPYNYSINAQFLSTLAKQSHTGSPEGNDELSRAFTQTTLPASLLVYPGSGSDNAAQSDRSHGDFDGEDSKVQLRSTVSKLEEKQEVLWQKMVELRADKLRLEKAAGKAQKRSRSSGSKRKGQPRRGQRTKVNGSTKNPASGGDESSSDGTMSSSSLNEDSSVQLTSEDEDLRDELEALRPAKRGDQQDEGMQAVNDEDMAEIID